MEGSTINNTTFHKLADAQQQQKKQEPTAKTEDDKLWESARELEGLFLSYVIKAMEKTIPKSGEHDKSNMANMMFSSVMGKALANEGGIGLARFFYNSIQPEDMRAIEQLKNNLNTHGALNVKSEGNSHEEG